MNKSGARSAIFGFVSWVVPLGLTFFATPLVVKHLGAKEYGLYALVLGFISYSFTFSIGRSITKYVSEYRAVGRDDLVNEILAATLWVNLIAGLAGVLILCLFARYAVVSLFAIEPESQEATVYAFYIAAATIFFGMQSQIFSGVVQAVHRLDVFSGIVTLISIAGIVGNVLIVFAGYGFTGLLLWNMVNIFLSCFWYYWAGKKLLPEAVWGIKCSRQIILQVAKFSSGIALSQFIFNFLLLFERGIITRTLGTQELTFYAVPMNLTGQIQIFCASILLVIFPMASELGAKMEIEKLKRMYERVSRYLFALVVFVVISVSMCGYDFFRLWLSQEFADESFYIVIMQAVTFGIIAVGIVVWQIMDGFGFSRTNALVAFLWCAVSLILMITLIPYFGLEGVAFGRMFGCVSMLIYILLAEKKIFGHILWGFWGQVVMLLSLPALLAAASEYFSLHYLLNGWAGLFVAGILGSAVYFSMLFATRFLTSEDWRVLHGLFFKAIPRFS